MSIIPLPVLTRLRCIGTRLARPDFLFWTLPLLIFLLVVGTIAQKDQGLLIAHRTYFSSFIVWFGLLPFPGGLTLLGLTFISLLAKFLMFSDWEWRKAGIILSHFGVLLLLIGGGFTALTQQESFMTLSEGQTLSSGEDYHQRELQIFRNDKLLLTRSIGSLSAGQEIAVAELPFVLKIDVLCHNCRIEKRPEENRSGWGSPGKFMQLVPDRPLPNDEENLTGIEFSVSGLPLENKRFLTFERFPNPPQISYQGDRFTITVARRQHPLPFSLSLEKFTRMTHPGTEMASAFRSDLKVHSGESVWPAAVSMNNPLRLHGYTIYQSSFDLSGEKPFSILHLVRNRGRLFPYVSSLLIACGLLLHLVLQMRQPRRAR